MRKTKSEISEAIRSLATKMTHANVMFALGNNEFFDRDSEMSLIIFEPKNRWDIIEEIVSFEEDPKIKILSFEDLLELEKKLENYDSEKEIAFLTTN